MLDRGLVGYDVIYTDGATVKDHNLKKKDERTVVYERTHVLQTWTYARFFGVPASTADSGVIIEVPLNSKLTPYSELTLDPKFAVSVVIPQFNPLGELMGVSGQIIGSGASLYTAKSLAEGWLGDYLYRLGYDDLAVHDAVSYQFYRSLLSRDICYFYNSRFKVNVIWLTLRSFYNKC